MRTDRQTDIRTYIYPPLDKRYSPIISSICGPNNWGAFGAQNGLPPSAGYEGSEYVLSFEIGQREGGFYSARINRRTDRRKEPPSTALVYRYTSFGYSAKIVICL